AQSDGGTGGGLFGSSHSNVSIINCRFQNNQAVSGGAIYFALGAGSLSISNTTLSSNHAEGYGGGLFTDDDNVELSSVVFLQNSSSDRGGAFYSAGPGLKSIFGSRFSNNTATNEGGAIFSTSISNISLANSMVNNNGAKSGAGIQNNGNLEIVDSLLHSNSASESGGGALSNQGVFSLGNSTITANVSHGEGNGGGIYNVGGGVGSITYSTISANTANNGGGIYADSGNI